MYDPNSIVLSAGSSVWFGLLPRLLLADIQWDDGQEQLSMDQVRTGARMLAK